MVIHADTSAIVTMNPSAQSMLGLGARAVQDLNLRSLCNPDDEEILSRAVKDCGALAGETRYLMLRLSGPDSPELRVEMTMVGCGPDATGRHLVIIQMRDSSRDSSLALFIRLVAEMPDGDSLLKAVLNGPLSRAPIAAATISVANEDRTHLVQVGAFGIEGELRQAFRVTPINPALPEGYSILNSEPVWMSIRAVAARFPMVANLARAVTYYETGEILSLPVTNRGVAVGSLFMMSERPLPRTWSFHEISGAVAQAFCPWMLLRRRELAAAPVAIPRSSPLAISDRERTILDLVFQGLSNMEIAEQLGYSEATVRADLGRMSKMLGVSGRREIVRRVKELGL